MHTKCYKITKLKEVKFKNLLLPMLPVSLGRSNSAAVIRWTSIIVTMQEYTSVFSPAYTRHVGPVSPQYYYTFDVGIGCGQ